MKHVLWECIHFEGDRLPRFDVPHVRFVRLRVNKHLGKVLRDGKDRWRLQRRGYRLSHIDIARYHRAIDRRSNHRVVKVGLGHRQSRGLLADLCLGLGNVRVRSAHRSVRGIIVSFGEVQLLLTHDSIFREHGGAVVVGFSLLRSGLSLFQIGSCRHKISFGIVQVGGGLEQRSLE